MATVHFETLGCKLNQIESESACKAFFDGGWEISVKPLTSNATLDEKSVSETKICVVNTCTVTTKAEQKCRHTINLLLKKFPNAAIVVTGCYAQVAKSEIEKISPRIAVIPGVKKALLAQLPSRFDFDFNRDSDATSFSGEEIARFIRGMESHSDDELDRFLLSTDTFFNHSRSSIKIQDGCGNSCSFCAIHIARGKPVSLDAETVLERVQKLETAGQKEVVLTGVNLSQYRSSHVGKNAPVGEKSARSGNEKFDIADLIEYLSSNTSSINFRLSSLYPERIDGRFLEALKNSRVRPHFHLSVQSGSDSILKAMNRPYTSAQVLKAVRDLRALYESGLCQGGQNSYGSQIEPFIACDIIVGFPGETDEDFEQTVRLCKECNFAWIHAFPFSARPGTVAAKMKNQIPQETARKRMNILAEIADNQKRDYIRRFEGKTVKAIMEKRQDGLCRCVTENFLHAHVQFPDKSEKIEVSYLWDKEIDVKITSVESSVRECECECIVLE